jgi:hypothetical protein
MTGSAALTPEMPKGWRFQLGVICFVAAFGVHVITIVAAAIGASAGTVATIAGVNFAANKILLVVTVGVLGKPGFNYLKSLVFSALGRYAPAQTVGPTRYRIGLVLLAIPILFGWLSPYLTGVVPELVTQAVAFGIAGDLLLLVSLIVLGGDFWDKLKALFIYGARVRMLGEEAGAPPAD